MRIKKRILIPICIFLALVLLIGGGIVYMNANSLGLSTGRVLISSHGSCMLIRDNSPINMGNPKNKSGLFNGLENGDEVLVLHNGINETYPGKTGAYAIFKLKDGDIDDIAADVLTSLTELGWWDGADPTGLEVLPETIPEDFSFALTWNCYGVSSYDSKTGKLVKTTDATHPEDYVTTCHLPEETTKQIYDMLRDLDIGEYPYLYNPYGNGAASEPPMSLILTVRIGETERTIRAEDISLSYQAGNKKGQTFLDVCREISDTLTATEEWKALPDYEFLYD